MGSEHRTPAGRPPGPGVPTLGESVRVAFVTLSENKVRSGLAMLGIIIGVFAVISLVSIGRSARVFVADQFALMGSRLILVMPGKRETIGSGSAVSASAGHKLTLEDAEAIRRRLPEVGGIAPLIMGLGPVGREGVSRNTWVTGTGPEYPFVRDHDPAAGRFFGPEDVEGDRRVAVLGSRIRRELFGGESPLGKFVRIVGTPFRVIGVMEYRGMTLGFDLDDNVYIPVTAARRLFGVDALSEIMVRARSSEGVAEAGDSIRELLRARHGGQDDVTLITQSQMLSSLNAILDALTFVLSAIAAVSLVVGGIGIMNIMLASVGERTREIGLRKSVGARPRDILAQFLVESTVLSLIGGLAGVLASGAALLAARRIAPALPVAVTLWAVVLAVVFSAAIGIFFGVFPARRASRLPPIEALRSE